MSEWNLRANAIFLDAVELPEVDRPGYLDGVCNGDAGLRRQVDALLSAAARSRDFIEKPIACLPRGRESAIGASGGDALFEGRYRLEERIGAGGMGVVFSATQTAPIVRKVAIKLIRSDGDDPTVVARFEQERQALALMEHPNIARVFDAGATADGKPYLVMEYIAGVALTDFCDREALTLHVRLALFVDVCRGLHHAHQKGVIHRDLKPSNVLVGDAEGRPTPKIIDFGVAKAINARLIDSTIRTGRSTLVGTLEYMAPEQAGLAPADADVDTRCDVYSMGVVLYELLTGLRPFDRERLKRASLDEAVRIVRDEEPPSLVKRLQNHPSIDAAAAARRIAPNALLAALRGDLNWIVFRCLARDREHRYVSANDLADDVARYLADQPIEARPPSSLYRLRKFAKRRRGTAIAATLTLLSLVCGTVGTTIGFLRAESARKSEADARTDAERARDQALDALDAMTSSVASEWLGTQQRATAGQKEFLTRAIESYRGLAFGRAEGELPRRRAANAARRVAEIQEMLWLTDQAIDSHRRAVEMFDSLVEDHPDEMEYRRVLGAEWGDLGRLYGQTRRATGEAEPCLRRAVDVVFEASARDPQNAQCRFDYVVHLQKLASHLQDAGRLDEALERLEQSLKSLERVKQERPNEGRLLLAESESLIAHNRLERKDREGAERHLRRAIEARLKLEPASRRSPRVEQGLFADRHCLGSLLVASKRRDEGFREYREAMSAQRKLADRFASHPAYRHDLASTMVNFAADLGAAGEKREQLSLLRSAVAELEPLVAEHPDAANFSVTYAGACCNLGNRLRQESRDDEALAFLDKAVAALDREWGDASSRSKRTEFLRNSLFNRAIAHQKKERWTAAAADYRKGIEVAGQNFDYQLRLAFCLVKRERTEEAVAEIGKLGADPVLTPFQRFSLAAVQSILAGRDSRNSKAFADQAMKNLEGSLRSGPPQPWALLRNDAFDPLRGRADFQRLVSEFPAPSAQSSRKSSK